MRGSVIFGCVLALAPAGAAWAQSPRSLVTEGNKAYQQKKYSEALHHYEKAGQTKPDSPRIWFNKGDALYRQGKFTEAMDAYEQAAVLSNGAEIEAKSKFNQGNAAFREGTRQAKADPSKALKQVEKSVDYYRDALRTDPSLNDARHNIEVARRVIEQLRQLKQQQQQQQNKNKNNKDKQQQRKQQQQSPGEQQQQGEQQQPRQGDQQQQQQQQQGKNQQSQQSQGQQQRPGQPKMQAAEKAKDILREEKENRRLRQLRARVALRPVDKDW